MKLLVGIDVSSQNLEVAMMTSDSSEAVFRDTFSNDLEGATGIKTIILTLNEQYTFDKLVIGMESTSIYSFHPAFFFKNDEDLAQFDTEAVVLNPRDTKRFKDIFEANKNDKIDAYYIADFLRVGHYTVGIVRQEEYISLQRLTRSRFEIVQSQTRSKQHYLENLYYKANKLVVDDVPASIFSHTMMDLIVDDMTTDELMSAPIDELIDYLNQKGRSHFADPEKLAQSIQKAVRGSYHLSHIVQDSIDTVLSVYAAEIRTYEKMIKQLNQEIEKVLAMLPENDIMQSFPGIGPVYAAGIIAEIGQIDRFDNDRQLAKYSGLAWKQNQSGSFNSSVTPMTHTGDKYLRYYLIEAAGSIVRYDPVFREYYDRKMSEVKKTPRKRALALTARKLIRVIDTLLRNHQLYQREELV